MKKVLIGVLILAGIFGAVLFATRGMDEEKSTSSNNQTTEQTNSQSEEMNQTEQVSENTIEIKNFDFAPEKLTIKKGTTVTWINKDDARHDVSPTSGGSDFTASKLLAKDESYQFTFNTVGTYEYKCSPHPYMKGTIEVVE